MREIQGTAIKEAYQLIATKEKIEKMAIISGVRKMVVTPNSLLINGVLWETPKLK